MGKEKKETREIKKGEVIHGFSSDVPGCWEIVSLRPFKVMAYQQGKKWIINVSRREWMERRLVEKGR